MRAKVLRATTCVAIIAVTVAACFDRTAAPPPSLAPVPRHDFLGDPNWAVNNSAASGSYDGVIDTIYGGAPAIAAALGPFVYPTFITVTVSGQVRQVPGALPGDGIVRDPYATNDPSFWGSMGFSSNGGIWWPAGPTATIRVVAPIAPFRNDAGGQPRGDGSHCGVGGYALCWTWAGSAHLEFTRLPVDLTLGRRPDTTAWQGTSATFTADMSPASIPGDSHPIVMAELQWRWLPDSVGTDTVACQSSSGSTCTHVFTSSGTMYAAAYVNGEAQQKSAHITVRIPTLDLTASQDVIADPGDNDTFVPVGNGTVLVQGWSFTPDADGGTPSRTGTSGAVLSRAGLGGGAADHIDVAILGSSTRQAVAKTPASTSLLSPSGSVRSIAAGSSWGTCAATDPVCNNFVSQSGTVEVIATVNGIQLVASTHVTVIPCPTGDKILDTKKVRDGLKLLMDSSRADGPLPFRVEQVGLIYKNPKTGEIFMRIYPNSDSNTGCRSTLPTSMPSDRPPDSWIIAEAHSHPFIGYSDSYWKEEVSIPCNFPPYTYYDDIKWGGLSKGDRDQVETDRVPDKDPNKPPHKIPEYVIDKQHIFRGDPGDLAQPVLPVHMWSRSTPTCAVVP